MPNMNDSLQSWCRQVAFEHAAEKTFTVCLPVLFYPVNKGMYTGKKRWRSDLIELIEGPDFKVKI